MKLIDLMRQAGVQWPDGAEYAAQDGDDGSVFFFSKEPTLEVGNEVWNYHGCIPRKEIIELDIADDWQTAISRNQWFDHPQTTEHTSPDFMREQQRLAAHNAERRTLVRELMLRHPQLTGAQAIEQADEIVETLEGLADGR